MNQSEQAQAIAEIKAIRNGGEYPRTYYREAIDKALEIVDSQAQKITGLKADVNGYEIALAIEQTDAENLRRQVAEQAKEIEILREVVKYDKYTNLAHIMKRRKDVSVFTHKKAEALQKLYEFDEVKCAKK